MATRALEDTPGAARTPGDDLVVAGVSKRFGGVPALTDVSLTVRAGTVHALVGENGAGKSTLGKIISGVVTPDEGTIQLGRDVLTLRSPRDALAKGIVTIAQELAIVPGLTVAENVYLGAEAHRAGFVRRAEARRRFRELAERVGFRLSPDWLAGQLTTADQQKVEIMRALSRDAAIVIMDEPTAALAEHETAALHAIIRSLAGAGKSVILVSHFLSEVLALADEITTLRDGRVIRTVPAAEATEETLIEGMLGRSLGTAFPVKTPPATDAEVVLSVEGLTASGVRDCSLEVRKGEIVGLAGLVGAGRSELARAIFRDARVQRGTVRLAGATLSGGGPHRALQRGLALIPESRKEMGLLVGRSVKENVSLSRLDLVSRLGWVSKARERRAVTSVLERTTVRAASLRQPVAMLSGGNQQKILFARAVMCAPRVLIADEPTRGVDVGSKRAIYDLIVEMARDGMGVVVISSELEEVLGLSHRVLVMRQGRIVAEFEGDDMNQQAVLAAAFSETSEHQGV
ncbi:MAG TPA: sugar ABC transporter ATP-binding protein [Acidimicrobiales bacterium]|nr:sugar ABC transporter ATP-binding protein [Acidimicrobiales bacterium]